jgi:energy-coupling factor transporter ATP-binding protein EcfA2
VLENVELALRVIGVVNAGSRKRAAKHALKLVGLREHADKFPYELSGGQRQRVAIARAFVKNPDVIIADEPTAALDSRTSKEILDLLKDLCRTKLLIIATHNKAIVRDYASRVIELKSGYTVRDELITDPSKVRVDELDLIIDKEIEQEEHILDQLIEHEDAIEKSTAQSVLADLGIDLGAFRKNVEGESTIDEALKQRLIDERTKRSKLRTRIHRFLQTSDDFFGKRSYANKAFLRNMGLHLFSALIFTVFLLTIVFGLNFVSETFGGFNEKALFQREMQQHNVLYFPSSRYESDWPDREAFDIIEQRFVNDFSQNEIERNRFFELLFRDPDFRYRYEQERIRYLMEELEAQGAGDIINVYYNNATILLRRESENIVFEAFSSSYTNLFQQPEPLVHVTEFLGVELPTEGLHGFSAMYADSNESMLVDHLLAGGTLPDAANEVAMPVAYLFRYGILAPSDFKDEYGNIMEVIPGDRISETFLAKDESERTIEITRTIVTFNDAGTSYSVSYDTQTTSFVVVGLLNFDGDINPYLDPREDIQSAAGSGEHFSFVFAKEAAEAIHLSVVDNSDIGAFERNIQYAEISREQYETYQVADIEAAFEEAFIGAIEATLFDQFEEWIIALRSASDDVVTYVQADLAGTNPDDAVLDEPVESTMFPGLTKRDLLHYYIAQHMFVINDQVEFNYLCSSCDETDRSFTELLGVADQAYGRLKQSAEYRDMLEDYGDYARLTYQESTNRIIFDTYGARFTKEFEALSEQDTVSLRLVVTLERETGSILSLLYVVVPRQLLEILPFVDSFIEMIEGLETNERFIRFLEQTNLDLLISSISTNAIRSVVMVILYVVVYVLLLVSVAFLSIVLINLYGNVYETATRRRITELASLRVLGTSNDDITGMIRLENRRVAVFSFTSFLLILFALSRLELFTTAPVRHFYMPLLGLFFHFNLYDVFRLNTLILILVSILFYLFIYRFIIRRVSTRKIQNIDTIQAIRDGDNL